MDAKTVSLFRRTQSFQSQKRDFSAICESATSESRNACSPAWVCLWFLLRTCPLPNFVFFFRPPCSPRKKVPRGTPVLSRAVLDHFWQISRFLGPSSPQDNIFAQKCLNPARTHPHELARTCTVNLKWAFFPHFSENLTICTNLNEHFSRTCTNLHELARTCTNLHEIPKIHTKKKKTPALIFVQISPKPPIFRHFCPNFSKTAHFASARSPTPPVRPERRHPGDMWPNLGPKRARRRDCPHMPFL